MIKYCAEGLSNKRISEKLDIPEEDIEDFFWRELCFPGWKYSLDIDTKMMYNSAKGDYKKFISKIYIVSPVSKKEDINKAFLVCKFYESLEDIIYDRYETS